MPALNEDYTLDEDKGVGGVVSFSSSFIIIIIIELCTNKFLINFMTRSLFHTKTHTRWERHIRFYFMTNRSRVSR